MSICNRCIHDEVCGLEDSHEEATTFCAHMIPKDVLDKLRAEIASLSNANPSYWHSGDMVEREEVLDIIDKYKGESEVLKDGKDKTIC